MFDIQVNPHCVTLTTRGIHQHTVPHYVAAKVQWLHHTDGVKCKANDTRKLWRPDFLEVEEEMKDLG
jgi:hypothetical protein